MQEKCLAKLPPLVPTGDEVLVELPSRRRVYEALLETVVEAMASTHPTITFIVGEWGEGKTFAWSVVVEPRLREAGFRTSVVRASTLYETMSGVGGRGWAERLVNALRVLTGGCCERTVVFIDEAEDLVYRGGFEELLEALHGLVDGEAGVRSLHVYVGLSPYAYTRAKAWPAWRRLERRSRVVRIEPVSQAEAAWLALRLLDIYAGGAARVLEDVRLVNAVAAASRGNLGALIVYVRRILAAWSRRGCSRLTWRDVYEILSEPVAAGVLEGGVDRIYARELEKRGLLREALLFISNESLETHEPIHVLEVDSVFDGTGFVDESGRLLRACGEDEGCRRTVYVLSEEVAQKLYGVRGVLAPFIPDADERRRVLRRAFEAPWLAALGLAHALRVAGLAESTPRCIGDCRIVLVEARLGGVKTRLIIAVESFEWIRVASAAPHIVVCLDECGSHPRPTVRLNLSASDKLSIAAVAAAIEDGVKIDETVLHAFIAYIDSKYRLVERLVRALREGEPRIFVPRSGLEGGALSDALKLVALLTLYGGVASVEQLAAKLGCTAARVRLIAEKLAKLEMMDVVDGAIVAYRVSPLEETVYRLIREKGGEVKLNELLAVLAYETPRSVATLLRLMEARGVVRLPKRLAHSSTVRLLGEPSLRSGLVVAMRIVFGEVERRVREAQRRRQQALAEVGPAARVAAVMTREAGTVRVEVIGKRVEQHRDVYWRRVLANRRREVHRLIEYLRVEGRLAELERVSEEAARAYNEARRGRVEDAAVQLADILAEYTRPVPSNLPEPLLLIEDEFARLRAYSRIAAKRAEALAAQAFYLTAFNLIIKPQSTR